MTRWRLFLFLLAGLSLLSGCPPDPKAVQKASFHFGLGTSATKKAEELRRTRERLQATIGEMEASQEEAYQ